MTSRLHSLSIYFLDTNIAIELGRWPKAKGVELMKALVEELGNAGWCITQDLSHAVTGYPQVTLEANTGQEVILQVHDNDDEE